MYFKGRGNLIDELREKVESANFLAVLGASGNGVAARALLRLGHLIGEHRYLASADRILRLHATAAGRMPSAHGSLVLAAGDSHGWGIIKEAETRWGGELSFETGTLYRALRRLTAAGLVRPADRRPVSDGRRRYFAITPLGRKVAAIEARRLEA